MHNPKPNKQKTDKDTAFDFIIYFFAITTPLFELPQAWLIYSNQSASNVSSATWMYFSLASLVFLIYAVKQRIRPLIIAYSLYLLIELVVVLGIIRYS